MTVSPLQPGSFPKGKFEGYAKDGFAKLIEYSDNIDKVVVRIENKLIKLEDVVDSNHREVMGKIDTMSGRVANLIGIVGEIRTIVNYKK